MLDTPKIAHLVPCMEGQRYVLVSYNRDGQEVVSLWADPDAQLHRHIVPMILAEIGENFTIIGGGYIRHETEGGAITIWGSSEDYGSPPIDRVRRVLESAFPDCTLRFCM